MQSTIPVGLDRKEAEVYHRLDPARLPRHIAIIMDGNGRWATQRGLPRVLGHGAGGAAARRVIELLARMRRFGGVAAAARECPVQSVGGAR